MISINQIIQSFHPYLNNQHGIRSFIDNNKLVIAVAMFFLNCGILLKLAKARKRDYIETMLATGFCNQPILLQLNFGFLDEIHKNN